MAKKNLHPKWYKTKVFCNDKLIFEVGSTLKNLSVEIWSGNHPFYLGSKKSFINFDIIDSFNKKYQLKE